MKTIAQQLNVKKFPFEIKDDNGSTIYWEDSDETWYKYEYDANNNQIYFENRDGFWYKREYDTNNNKIYYKDSNGSWFKREFDTNNNVIYYEDSAGTLTDNRPNQSCSGKVVEIDGKKYKLTEV